MAFKLIEHFAARLQSTGVLTGSIGRAPWIDDFERKLERRLPPSFRHLVTRYTFRPFDWGPVLLFGNSEMNDALNLHVAAVQDQTMWQVTRQAGMIPFGRPHTGSYDPICFGHGTSRRESPIIQLNHESILVKGRAKIIKDIAPSFLALVELLMTDGSGPVAVDSAQQAFSGF